MTALVHRLQVTRSARYFTLQGTSINEIWFVLHGYGQLAEYFIRNFEKVKENRLIVAPEGLSKFYLSNNSGRVGASWMTKEDRQTEILEQSEYLSSVVRELQNLHGELPLNLLGFSQGTATAIRWMVSSPIQFNRIILWAGDVPNDISCERLAVWSRTNELDLVFGDEDPYFTKDRREKIRSDLTSRNIEHHYHQFHGGHSIDKKLLSDLLS